VVNKEATEIVSDKEVNGEASFWVGITLAGENDTKEAIKYLKRAYKQDVRWAELVERLPEAKLLPDDPALIKKLLKGMKK
ncbi:MAG: hypothetical protein KAI81_08480, partial [Candidatus Marinimicrobia bacterium]|nr:hypothetical protein [Candidatus Neomarinimicrobiota bacterium]